MKGSSEEGSDFNPAAIIEALDRNNVEYLVVGGYAVRGYGAARQTSDVDCLAKRELENLHRLGQALKDLGARLRVEGLDDEQAKALPVQLDGFALSMSEITNWRTDAGDLDVLVSMPGADGRRLRYEELVERSAVLSGTGFAIRSAALEDIIASKQWADRPKDREALPELLALAASSREGVEEEAPFIGDLVEACHPAEAPASAPPTAGPTVRPELAPERSPGTGLG